MTIDDKIRDEKLQSNINPKTAGDVGSPQRKNYTQKA